MPAHLLVLPGEVPAHLLVLLGEVPAHDLVLIMELLARVVRARQDESGEGHRDSKRGAEDGDGNLRRVGPCRVPFSVRGARPCAVPCHPLAPFHLSFLLPFPVPAPSTFAGVEGTSGSRPSPETPGGAPCPRPFWPFAGRRAMGNPARSSQESGKERWGSSVPGASGSRPPPPPLRRLNAAPGSSKTMAVNTEVPTQATPSANSAHGYREALSTAGNAERADGSPAGILVPRWRKSSAFVSSILTKIEPDPPSRVSRQRLEWPSAAERRRR